MRIRKTLFALVILFVIPGLCFAQKYTVEKLSSQINTPGYDEISPVLSPDGTKLYFTRVGYPFFQKKLVEKGQDLSTSLTAAAYSDYLKQVYSQIAGHPVHNPERSGFNQDIWVAHRESGKDFIRIEHPEYPLNNALPNSVCSMTPAENELVVINQFVEGGGMKKGFSVMRQQPNGNWAFPEAININNYHNSGPDVSMTMSQDGSVIILSLERHDSRGKSDLYVCFKKGVNQWTEPMNLGKDVNSRARETTPFLSPDKKTLFFSSNRGSSLGGNDIFMIERLDNSWRKWSKTRRFVAPINSRADDSQPYFDGSTGFLYFTSKREGSSDIYRVRLGPPIPAGVTIRGRILNSKTGELVTAKVLSELEGTHYKNAYVSDDGTFKMTIPRGTTYKLTAQSPGYTSQDRRVHFKASYVYYKEYQVDLMLTPMEVGTMVDLDPIFFQQSKPVVLQKSYPALNKLARFLRENPNIYIRINGHTDNVGDNNLLQVLSEQRARSIKDYLVYKKGINPVRIKTIGYGASRPIADNRTEDARAKNRRVEVEITHVDEGALGMQGD